MTQVYVAGYNSQGVFFVSDSNRKELGVINMVGGMIYNGVSYSSSLGFEHLGLISSRLYDFSEKKFRVRRHREVLEVAVERGANIITVPSRSSKRLRGKYLLLRTQDGDMLRSLNTFAMTFDKF